jgi:hypothetical protein
MNDIKVREGGVWALQGRTQLATKLGIVPALLVKVDSIADSGDSQSANGNRNDRRGLHEGQGENGGKKKAGCEKDR